MTRSYDNFRGRASAEGDLTAEHRRMLVEESGIDPAVIAERGYRSLAWSPDDLSAREELRGLGIATWALREDTGSGLLIPMYSPTGELISYQWRPDGGATHPDGHELKYLSPAGEPNHIDVHPRNTAKVRDTDETLWITEGAKKADALASRGHCVGMLTGVYNWRNKLGTLGDWEDVPIRGRTVVLCFDGDARRNRDVATAMGRLGAWLRGKGAECVLYALPPDEVNGTPTKGADDFLAAGGDDGELLANASRTPPKVADTRGAFADAALAETVADEVMTDLYCWARGLDWLRWDGQRWVEVGEVTVIETVRGWARHRFTETAARGSESAKDWLKVQSTSRLRAITALTRGIVEVDAADFDADPHALNTPRGVVDLRTGAETEHRPAGMHTKITRGSYRPGHTHPDVEMAKEALPPVERGWLQRRYGQGVTGKPTPDGITTILHGPAGENGKSALCGAVIAACGDYADTASHKLFMSTKGSEHSTEMADLRGRRLLVAEEIAEGHAIDVTALKRIQDTPLIKARYVYRDNMTFVPSHSLFATSNYRPVVSETDGGTWRRLALLVFPYRFRKPHEPLDGPNDRRGDPGLKDRLHEGADGRHDAVVTWLVEGAMAYYADPAGALALTPTIREDTDAWRAEADRVAGFWRECLVPAPGAAVPTADMLSGFNTWLRAAGHAEWSKETFHGRFLHHEHTVAAGVEKRRVQNPTAHYLVSRFPGGELAVKPEMYVGVRRRDHNDDRHAAGDGDESAGQGEVPEVPDLLESFAIENLTGEFPEGSGTSGTSRQSPVGEAPATPSPRRPATPPTPGRTTRVCRGCGAGIRALGTFTDICTACQRAAVPPKETP